MPQITGGQARITYTNPESTRLTEQFAKCFADNNADNNAPPDGSSQPAPDRAADNLLTSKHGEISDQTAIVTECGHILSFLTPQPSAIVLKDILNSLCRLPRFVGHTTMHYTVGQHSCLLYDAMRQQRNLNPFYWFAGLVHDFHEAYIGDINSPLKALLLPLLAPIVRRLDHAIRSTYDLPLDYPPAVRAAIKHYDKLMYFTESEQLRSPQARRRFDFNIVRPTLPITIVPWGEQQTRSELSQRFHHAFADYHLFLTGTFTDHVNENPFGNESDPAATKHAKHVVSKRPRKKLVRKRKR